MKGGASTEVRPTTEFFYRVFQGQMRLWLLLLFNCPLPVQGVGGVGVGPPIWWPPEAFLVSGLDKLFHQIQNPKKKDDTKKNIRT